MCYTHRKWNLGDKVIAAKGVFSRSRYEVASFCAKVPSKKKAMCSKGVLGRFGG